MAEPSAVRLLAGVAAVALLLVPTALWLSGRLADDAERPFEPPGSAPLATLPAARRRQPRPPGRFARLIPFLRLPRR